MELVKFNDRIFYLPHETHTDRPLLAYIKGDKLSLAIDAGNSADHVDEFYKSLEAENLKKPEVTIITHWHWDHTFGMHNINGLSIAHKKTNEFLKEEKNKLRDSSYLDNIKKENIYLAREYANNEDIIVTLSDIEFDKKLVINLGGIKAKIFHTKAPHSEDTVLIYIPEEKILFLGDSTSEDFFNNNYMDINKLKSLIETIGKIECKTCILGHAEPLNKNDLLDYLESLL